MIQGFSSGLIGNRELIYETDLPSFQRDFASVKTLDHGTGPAITFTRASNATYFDVNGVLQTAANDVARFDHSSTGSSLGLLIEESRTNSLRNSQAGGAVVGAPGTLPTNWGTVGITGGADVSREIVATGTEAGMSYVDIRLYGTASSSMFVGFDTSTGIVAADGQTWTGSVYVKLVAGSMTNIGSVRVQVRANDVSGSVLQSGTTTFTPSSSLIRHSHALVFNNASIARTRFGLAFFDAVGAIDITLRIAAPQLERGEFATSYIATTTAAATRSTDEAIVNTVSSFYNQTEGTMFAELEPRGQLTSARYVQFDDETNSNRIVLGLTSSSTVQNFTTVAGNTTLSSTLSGTIDAGAIYKMGAGFATDNMVSAANGTLGTVDTSGAMPSGIVRLRLDGQLGSAATRGHWLRKFAYWPKRLTNTLLEQLTT